MSLMGRAFDRVLDATGAISCIILVVMMVATVVKVVMRAVFNQGMLGIDQVSGIMMVYMTFLGAAWVLRAEGHVMVDLLTTAVRPRVNRALNVLASLIGAGTCFVLAYYAGNAIALSLQRGVMVAAELEIPRAVNLFAIPFGCALLGIEFLRRARRFQLGTQPAPAEIEGH